MPNLKHYIDHTSVRSDLVYPCDKGYYYVARLDDSWVKSKLQTTFNRNIISIDNKYVVQLKTNTGKDILVYNHDGKHWLIEKP
jgi:hypothetical protein